MAQLDGSASLQSEENSVAQDDGTIAQGLNAGLRRLVVRALVHSAGDQRDQAKMNELMVVLTAEVGRLAFRAEGGQGENTDLTAAVRRALMILLNAARREAASDLAGKAETSQQM